jgi:hypothetical protein
VHVLRMYLYRIREKIPWEHQGCQAGASGRLMPT